MRNIWLLTWNPKNWEWKAYHEWATGTKQGDKYIEPWTVVSKKIAYGDELDHRLHERTYPAAGCIEEELPGATVEPAGIWYQYPAGNC